MDIEEEEKILLAIVENLTREIAEVIKKHTGVDAEFSQKINQQSLVLNFKIMTEGEE